MCGFNGGNNLSVSAGNIAIPADAVQDENGNYTMLVDGSDYMNYAAEGELADNGAPYPADANLTESVPLPDGSMSSSDYAYIFEICPASQDTCFVWSSTNGTVNPADLAGDGSLPPLPVGSEICVSGFAYSLGEINAILDFVANDFVCDLIEEELPSGYDCNFISALADENISDLNELFGLTALFGYTANRLEDALFSIWSVERLLNMNGFSDLTPCYSSSAWPNPVLSVSSLMGAMPGEPSEEEQIEEIAAELASGTSAYCITVVEGADCAEIVDGASVFGIDGAEELVICTSGPPSETIVSYGNTGNSETDYAYILTTASGAIVSQIAMGESDFTDLTANEFRVYGVSYTGSLDFNTGADISSLSSDECFSLSSNWVSITLLDGNCGVANEDISLTGISLYPNPSTEGKLYLEGDLSNVDIIQILDMQGRQIPVEIAHDLSSISIDHAPAGNYLLNIHYKSGQSSSASFVIR